MELENLTLTTQPFKTLKFSTLAVIQYIKKTTLYLLAKGGWLMLFSVAVGTLGIVLMTLGCLHEKVFLFLCIQSVTYVMHHSSVSKKVPLETNMLSW